MKKHVAQISLFILLIALLSGCNAVKRVPDGEHLLVDHTIYDGDEKLNDAEVYNLLPQKLNTRLLTYPLRLHIYNQARSNIDSILAVQAAKRAGKNTFWVRTLSRKQVEAFAKFKKSINTTIKETGEAPTLASEAISEKTANKLAKYYANNGYFNATVDYEITRNDNKRATADYTVTKRNVYTVDSLKTFIKSPAADSIYKKYKKDSRIQLNQPYKATDIANEIGRLTTLYRNNGLYHFDADRIKFIGDTVNTNNHARLELFINNRIITSGDGNINVPFKVHRIKKVNIITDNTFANQNKQLSDSTTYEGYNFYSYDKLRYRPKALANVIPLKPGHVYKDTERTATLSRLNSLRTFKYPSIEYREDPADSTGVDLIATINLTPLDRYKLRADFNVSTSNIQQVGIAGFGSILTRNIFGGAETLELSLRGSIGASDDAANTEDRFFDITELGADLKLTFPRLFFPFINTTNIIPPEWEPNTLLSVGVSSQENIGLDKQTFTGGLSYQWKPTRKKTFRLDLSDAQYVRNLKSTNYFNIYNNSFNDLNDIALETNGVNPNYFNSDVDDPELTIPSGAQLFIRDIQNGTLTVDNDTRSDVNAIEERRDRLTQNNLILSTAFTYTHNTKTNLFDDTFSRFRGRLELSGNLLDAVSSLADLPRAEDGSSTIFGVRFSQYVKTELDFVKHWNIGGESIFAVRAFGGIAIPYGNSNSIPFIRSFFAGGTNDNRGWRPYQLGPGSTGGANEFNEANLKLAFNGELRFKVIGGFEGALFVDAGNIWNVFDNVDEPGAVFSGFDSLLDIAVASGFGIRYDFDFFVFRFDTGFKTYNPALTPGDRWFKQYNFSKAVYNIGINYPF